MRNFYIILEAIGGCAFLVTGLHLLSNNLLELAEVLIYRLFKNQDDSSGTSLAKGILVSTLCGSTNVANSTLLGLVNAGLVKLRSALLYLSGAHLGPLIWLALVSFISFNTSLVFLSISLLTYFLSRGQWGKWFHNSYGLFLGIGLIGIGKYFFKDGLRMLGEFEHTIISGGAQSSPLLVTMITGFIVGSFLAWIFKSSTITMILLMVARAYGYFDLGFILPAVVGVHCTTFWPIRQMAKRGNVHAQRLAKGQEIFSLLGLILGLGSLFFFNFKTEFNAEWIIFYFFLALRISNVIVFSLLIRTIRRLLHQWYPDRGHKESYELDVLGRSRDMVPSMALIQATFHIKKFKSVVDRLFNLTESYLSDTKKSARILAKIKDYERITDNMKSEIDGFFSLLIENSLSPNQAVQLQSLTHIADELETIADYIDKLASYNTRYLHDRGEFGPEMKEELVSFFQDVKEYYFSLTAELPFRNELDEHLVSQQGQKLKLSADRLRIRHMERISDHEDTASNLMTYSDLIVCLRKIRGHSLKVFNHLF